MAFWDRFKRLRRSRADPGLRSLPTGRATSINHLGTLSPSRSRTKDILETLRRIPDKIDAIEYLGQVTPDVAMAIWNFLRLANQGHTMEFKDLKGKKLPKVEEDWRDNFAARVNEISNSGLDGLIDGLHYNAFVKGGQGAEVEVVQDRTDIHDVYIVDPQTIYWEVEERNGRKVWIPYQQQNMKKVSLEPGKANFFWVPTDATSEDPRGTLHLAPVLQSIDFQIQTLQDLQMVLHRQGWPRNDIKILMERLLAIMPPEIKAGGDKKMREWLSDRVSDIENAMNKMKPDSDYLHTDDVEITMNKGGNASRSLDVRAIAELVDQQVMTGAKQLSVFMNRNTGVTETFGTVQFKIACGGIASIQRGSKRIIEEIARLWLRVRGIQAVPHFEHNKLDWQSEEQRMTVKLMTEKFWAIAQLMGWVDEDTACQEVISREKAVGKPTENVRVSFNMGGEADGPKTNKKAEKAVSRAGSHQDP